MTHVLQFPQRGASTAGLRVYLVQRPIVGLIAAKPGQVLVLWPDSREHTLSVCRRAAVKVVERSVGANAGEATDAVTAWEASGALSLKYSETETAYL